MSEPTAKGYVVKLVYSARGIDPRWVSAGRGRGLGPREHATVFPDHETALAEAQLWKKLSTQAFSVVVDPA